MMMAWWPGENASRWMAVHSTCPQAQTPLKLVSCCPHPADVESRDIAPGVRGQPRPKRARRGQAGAVARDPARELHGCAAARSPACPACMRAGRCLPACAMAANNSTTVENFRTRSSTRRATTPKSLAGCHNGSLHAASGLTSRRPPSCRPWPWTAAPGPRLRATFRHASCMQGSCGRRTELVVVCQDGRGTASTHLARQQQYSQEGACASAREARHLHTSLALANDICLPGLSSPVCIFFTSTLASGLRSRPRTLRKPVPACTALSWCGVATRCACGRGPSVDDAVAPDVARAGLAQLCKRVHACMQLAFSCSMLRSWTCT